MFSGATVVSNIFYQSTRTLGKIQPVWPAYIFQLGGEKVSPSKVCTIENSYGTWKKAPEKNTWKYNTILMVTITSEGFRNFWRCIHPVTESDTPAIIETYM